MNLRQIGCVVAFTTSASSALALMNGQTGEFPASGQWSATNWNWAHSYVYQWNTYWNGQDFHASAVAVGERYLLTAGHVGGDPGAADMWIGTTKYVPVRKITFPVYPDQSSPPDLCLVEVDKNLPGFHSIYTGSLSDGQDLFMIGYGVGGTYNGSTFSADGSDRIGRWGTNKVHSTPYQPTWDSSVLFSISSWDTDTTYESLLADGDSGSGAFVLNNGQWQLAGIGVRSDSYSTAYDVALQQYAPFIAQTVPEPGTLLTITGLVAMLGVRRRMH